MGPEPPSRTPGELSGDDLSSAVLGPTEVATFENLYLAYRRDGLRLAQRLLGDSEHAADAVHAAFLEILRYLLSGRRWYDPGDARAVVLRNVRWAALNIARARSRREEMTGAPLSEESAVADDWARIEVRQLCEEIVRRLRPRDRDALHLHFVEGLSHAEAATRVGTNAAAFQKQLARALDNARRGARSVGAASGVAAAPGMLPRRVGMPKPGRQRCARGRFTAAMAKVATVGSLVAGAGAILGAVGPGNGPSTIQSVTAAALAVRPSAAPSAPVQRDGLDTSAVVDAVQVRTRSTWLLLALGEGRGCHCWTLFRSRDGGVSWDSMPGPATLPADPRLELPRGLPQGPRIFIVSAAPGGPVLAAAGFGAEFAPVAAPAPAWARVTRASENGNVLAMADRYMYVALDGSVFCSRPGHPDWRLACQPSIGM